MTQRVSKLYSDTLQIDSLGSVALGRLVAVRLAPEARLTHGPALRVFLRARSRQPRIPGQIERPQVQRQST
jgi:hypothetical protein